ncbi:MAG TPA: MFS transporter [Gemmataceae bacterium]|nr:MFS transporter [Gemmataceae bacterium]
MGLNGNQPITRAQWLTLAAALLGWMFDGFEQGIFPLVARPALVDLLNLREDAAVAADKGRDDDARAQAKQRIDARVGAWNGNVGAAFLVGAALGGWFFGWLGDRLGRVRAMVFSVLTYALFTGLCGLAQSAWQLAGLRLLSSLGMGGEWALGVALVMESWEPEARPLLAGLIGAAANVGFILTGVLVTLLLNLQLKVDEGGWRWVLGACAFPALLTFFLRMFVPESEKWHQAVRAGPRAGIAEIFTPQLRGHTAIGTVLACVALIGTWGAVQWIPLWVKQMTDSQQMANNAQMASGLGAVLGALSGALLGQRLGRRRTYFVLCLGSLLVCAWLFRWHFQVRGGVDGWFFALVLLTGACTASFYGWLPLYLPELFPTRVRATGQGFSYNFGRILAAGGSLSMGFLMSDRVFHGDYARAGATISLIYVVGLAVIWLAPETRGKPLPE